MKTKVKFALNLLLLVGILGVMYFFVRNSMMDISDRLLQWFLSDCDVWGRHLNLRGEFLP